jgi:hypothetical protein
MNTLLTLRPMLHWSRLWAIALAFALLVAAAGAGAAPADATDEAFGALLAMPGAQPREGGWIIPQAPAQDEPALIARWQRLRKEGADFNAMRHGGTLLAHAIRAGKQSAALWLLHNGADPRKVLRYGGEDAYTLARKYERLAVVAALETRYGFKPAPAAAAGAKPATPSGTPPAAAPVTLTRVEYAVALLKQSPDEKTQQAWRRHAATLGDEEFRSVFKDGEHFEQLVRLTQDVDGGLEEALARLPVDRVRRMAQVIADVLAAGSWVSYGDPQRIAYSGASRSWPALWRRLDRPLKYDRQPHWMLAGKIPPSLWPDLFASGYANRDVEVTGCLLAAIDAAALQTLWLQLQRDFTNAKGEAAGLVLSQYRLSPEPCYWGSTQLETVAKLAFLRANGVTGPVYGLLQGDRSEPIDPRLGEMMRAFTPAKAVEPRLGRVASDCRLTLDAHWWTALVRASREHGRSVQFVQFVHFVDMQGGEHCGLNLVALAPEELGEWLSGDSFFEGPTEIRVRPSCPSPGAGGNSDILMMGPGGVRSAGPLPAWLQVLDRKTGKRYALDTANPASTPTCAPWEWGLLLPAVYEWKVDSEGPKLVDSLDNLLVARLLRQQCRISDDENLICQSFEPRSAPLVGGASALDRLRQGSEVQLRNVLDDLGADRRAAYKAAIAARDRAQLRQLREDGIPVWWTAAEIEDLAKADLALEEKRRRIALLFADADHLTEALSTTSLESLATWLPRQDWAPILRIIAKEPDRWFQAVKQVRPMVKDALGCDLDRAQAFLCGGGLQTD